MDIKKYKNKMQYPEVLRRPHLNHTHSSEKVIQYAEDLKKYEDSLPKYQEEKQKYRVEENRLYDLFKQDAFEELAIEKHPKKDILWSIAWERGHDGGLQNVWAEVQELSELLT